MACWVFLFPKGATPVLSKGGGVTLTWALRLGYTPRKDLEAETGVPPEQTHTCIVYCDKCGEPIWYFFGHQKSN